MDEVCALVEPRGGGQDVPSRPGWFGVAVAEMWVGQAGQMRPSGIIPWTPRWMVTAGWEFICWMCKLGVTAERMSCAKQPLLG